MVPPPDTGSGGETTRVQGVLPPPVVWTEGGIPDPVLPSTRTLRRGRSEEDRFDYDSDEAPSPRTLRPHGRYVPTTDGGRCLGLPIPSFPVDLPSNAGDLGLLRSGEGRSSFP